MMMQRVCQRHRSAMTSSSLTFFCLVAIESTSPSQTCAVQCPGQSFSACSGSRSQHCHVRAAGPPSSATLTHLRSYTPGEEVSSFLSTDLRLCQPPSSAEDCNLPSPPEAASQSLPPDQWRREERRDSCHPFPNWGQRRPAAREQEFLHRDARLPPRRGARSFRQSAALGGEA